MGKRTKPAGERTISLIREAKAYSSWLMAQHTSTLLFIVVFTVEAALGMFVIRDLRTAYGEVKRIYVGSVQSLHRVGELQYETQEARRTTLYALTTNDGNLQVEYAEQSRAADRKVSEGIAEYLAQARLPREIETGRRLSNDWQAYLKVRDNVLGFILEDSPKEAVSLDLTSGVALFDRVRQGIEEVKHLYDERRSQELILVTDSLQRSAFKLAGGFGFALTLASAGVWAIQKNKMKSEMRLAKLQMDFVASISHELRTPITAILCAGENVRDGIMPGEEDRAEQGSIIVDQATQLAALVDQVLLFAATTAKPRYTLQPVEVSEILASALKNTAALLQKSEFMVHQRIQPGLPQVLGDLPAISQCLQNLIVNAVKYGGRERRIDLSAALDDSVADRKEIRIDVQDHGLGISNSDLPRIFEPFYRSPRVVAAQIHGTGLGLSIAKRMIEAAGGRLSAISEADTGSKFTLHLPVLPEEDSQDSAVTSAVGRGSFQNEGKHTAGR